MDKKGLEALIIGGGPAGVSASIFLKLNGISSVIVDKADFPRDKVCGDAVSGEALLILKKIGLLKRVEEKGCKCSKKELYPEVGNPKTIETEVINIPRKELDSILLKKAEEMGVDLIKAKFTGNFEFKKNVHKVEFLEPGSLKRFNLYAKYLIIATGCQSDLALSHLKKYYKIAAPDQVAYRGYYKADWPVTERRYYFLKELNPGYLWIFPVAKGIFNVGCGGKILKARKLFLKDILSRFIQKTDGAYNCKGEWVKSPKGAVLRSNFPNLKYTKQFPNQILIGEAMGSTYPFSGGGIGKAMKSGILAAESIVALKNKGKSIGLSKIYSKKINKEMKPAYYLAFKLCDYLLTKTVFRGFVYRKVFKNKTYPDIISNIICGTLTPKQICSIKFIFKFLFSK